MSDAIENEMHGDAYRVDADRGELNADLILLILWKVQVPIILRRK
jgi:hypothetical protein